MWISGNRAAFALAALTTLAACTSGDAHRQEAEASNISGRMLHSPELFTGTSTAGIDSNGALSLKSDQGAVCTGPYTLQREDNAAEVALDGGTPRAAEAGVAKLQCRDGRSGSIMFMVGRDQAVGTGMLGTDIVTLTIDDD